MVKKYHFQLDAIDKQLVKLQSEQAEVEALQRQIGMTRDIEEAVKLQRQITEEEALKRQIGITPAIDQWLGTMRTAGLDASEIYRRQFNPTASEIFEQMDQKAIDDAKLRRVRPLTEIDFTPPFDFQRTESDRRDRQRERDREHDIETARLAEIARLQVRDEHEASKQAALVAGAAVTNAPVVVAPTPSTSTPAKLKRRDELWPVIEKAQREVDDPFDAVAIRLKLCEWAQAEEKTFPLIGVTGDSIQWSTDPNDDPKELTQRGLRDRLGKQKRREQPKVKTPLKSVK